MNTTFSWEVVKGERMITQEIELSEPQLRVFESRKPLTLNMAGQRAGKSHLIGFKSGLYVLNAPKIRGMIAANTYMQLTQSTMVAVKKVWKDYFGLSEYDKVSNPSGDYVIHKRPPRHFNFFIQFDEYRSIISFKNGCVVYMASLENYMAHDGKEIGWAELDETKDTREEALKAVILARLSQPGLYYHTGTLEIFTEDDLEDPDQDINPEKCVPYNPCCINTSPAVGVVKWLTDMFNLPQYEKEIHKAVTDPLNYYYHEKESQAVCIYSTFWNEDNLPKNYIEIRLSNLSEGEGLKYVYGYPFARTGSSYFRSFDKLKHTGDHPYIEEIPIHISLDFNVKPYMTMLCAQVYPNERTLEYEIRIYKEYCLPSPLNSTEAICREFLNDHEDYDPMVFIYGDASGDYRQAGSGDITQFDVVRDMLADYTSRASFRVPRKNKSVFNRRDFIDRILEGRLNVGYNGQSYAVRIMIDKSCEELIGDMQWLKEGVDGKLKEKEKDEETGATYEKLGHTSDALEYFICEVLEEYYDR